MSQAGSGQPDQARPHVVLFRPYDVTVDTRAKKIALSLSRLGYRVTLLATAKDGVASVGRLGDDVTVELRPVAYRVRDANARRRNALRTWQPPLAPKPEQVTARKLRLDVQRREVKAAREAALARTPEQLRPVVGTLFRAREAALVARRKGVSARVRLQRLSAGQWRQGWRAYDHLVKKVRFGSSWHAWLTDVYDWDLTFGPRLVELAPDVLHVHDPKVLGVVVGAAARLREAGRQVRVVYDARENFAGLPEREWGSPRYHQAIVGLEASFIHAADRVLTVSEPIADTLQERYDLPRRPSVVLNLPVDHRPAPPEPGDPVPPERDVAAAHTDVRRELGLPADVPLLVYSGGLSHARGADVLVEALGRLDGVHLVMVTVPHPHPMTPGLMELAERHGAGGRLHVLPPVGQRELIGFLATATVGVHPMPGGSPNHEMALPNKLFEYLHAGLPLVVSDAAEISRFVRDHGIGEVFRTGDAASFADAVAKVLVDPSAYRLGSERAELVRQFSWQGQEPVLGEIYGQLATPPGGLRSPGWEFPDLAVRAPELPADQPGGAAVEG